MIASLSTNPMPYLGPNENAAGRCSTALKLHKADIKAEDLIVSPLSATYRKSGFAAFTKYATPTPTPTVSSFDDSGIQIVEDISASEWKDRVFARRIDNIIPLPSVSSFAAVARALDELDDNKPLDIPIWDIPTESLSPLWDEDSEEGLFLNSSFGFLRPHLDDDTLSDPEGSDSESDISESLLFQDLEPLWRNPKSFDADMPTLKAMLSSQLPVDLQSVLSDVHFDYDLYTEKLAVVIQSGSNANVDLKDSDCIWPPHSIVFDISIAVAHSVNCNRDIDEMEKQLQFISWILKWAQTAHGKTIKSIDISIPEDFSAVKNPDDVFSMSPTDSMANFAKLQSVSWSGDLRFLSNLLPSLGSNTLKVLKVHSDLSIDDALLLLRQYPSPKLHTLELTSVTDCPPSLLPIYEAKESANPHVLPLTLQHVDSLKIVSSTSLQPFFDALSLPDLCKLEIDVTSGSEETFHSLAMLPLSWENLFYVDVRYDGTFESGEMQKGLMKQKAPFAYVSVNGEGDLGY